MPRLSAHLLSACFLLSGLALTIHSYGNPIKNNKTGENPITLKIRNEGWYLLNYEFDRYICTHNEIGSGSIISGSLLMGRSTSYPIYDTNPTGLQCRVKVCPTPCYESFTHYYTITKSTTIRCSGNIFTFNCDLY